MNEKRAHIFVSGRVQRVLFRDGTRRKARKLGISGWVRNLPDGRVEIIAEGEKGKIQELIIWAKKGPFLARVDNLEVEREEYQGKFDNFKVRY